jgi:acyl-CoA synthetase (NDP forming)
MNEMKECEKIIEQALKEKRASLQIDEAQRICALHQIPTPKYHVAKRVDEAVEKASEIGYPIALKIISPQITHKSDVGGVILNVGNEMELRTQFEKLTSNIRNRDPSAMISGVMIEEMIPASIEVVVGGIVDNQFGRAVMFGVGGIFTEVYDDVVFRVAPIDRIDALNMIRGLRGSKILEGTRGKPPADIDSIVNVLTRVSDLILEHGAINQLDLNPVIVFPKGVYAVDSRMIIASVNGGV